jgi:hypothetical protein
MLYKDKNYERKQILSEDFQRLFPQACEVDVVWQLHLVFVKEATMLLG